MRLIYNSVELDSSREVEILGVCMKVMTIKADGAVEYFYGVTEVHHLHNSTDIAIESDIHGTGQSTVAEKFEVVEILNTDFHGEYTPNDLKDVNYK